MPAKAAKKPYRYRHPLPTKLTAAKARQIYRLYTEQGWTQRRLGKKFGVSRSCIYGVTSRETWKEATANAGY